MGRKRCITLTESERLTLREALKYHSKHEFRRSCQALLWSAKGWAVKSIAAELDVCRFTVGNWLTAWQQKGLVGLIRQKGQGRKPVLKVVKNSHQQATTKVLSAHFQTKPQTNHLITNQIQLDYHRLNIKPGKET